MKSSERENYVRYRLEKSEETYEVAMCITSSPPTVGPAHALYVV